MWMHEIFIFMISPEMLYQIEKANIEELDWALANMGSRKTKKTKPSGGREDWIHEVESKANVEEVCVFEV
jgi:hypothetical protein